MMIVSAGLAFQDLTHLFRSTASQVAVDGRPFISLTVTVVRETLLDMRAPLSSTWGSPRRGSICKDLWLHCKCETGSYKSEYMRTV